MDKDVKQLRRVVMGHGAVRQAANVGTGAFDKHSANISDEDFFSERSNGRLIKSDLRYQPGKPLLKPLPKR
ncbi:MAG: hypothetical protein ACREOZ_00490 [Gloeomargaritales cyanobacterium]